MPRVDELIKMESEKKGLKNPSTMGGLKNILGDANKNYNKDWPESKFTNENVSTKYNPVAKVVGKIAVNTDGHSNKEKSLNDLCETTSNKNLGGIVIQEQEGVYTKKYLRDYVTLEYEKFQIYKEEILKKISNKVGVGAVNLSINDFRFVFVLAALSKIYKSNTVKASRNQMKSIGISESRITPITAKLERLNIIKKHPNTIDNKNREFVEFEILF